MNDLLEGLEGVKVIVDDILIYGKGENFETAVKDHDKNLLKVLEQLRKNNVKLNPDKIKFKTT